jgi:N-ethylmaleimide reductase
MKNKILFESFSLNKEIELKNRIAMAPMTRCMADKSLVPTQQSADYYGRRADAGLIITEATIIRPDGQGYPNTPGIFSKEQVKGWQKVTKKVHQKDGKIFLQLWHCGKCDRMNPGDPSTPGRSTNRSIGKAIKIKKAF